MELQVTDISCSHSLTSEPEWYPQKPSLPPCRVCGEKGTGFHYGLNTCDSCKGFFQRSSTRKTWPKCLNSSNCLNATSRSGMCATCRYNKCIRLGMSKNASKTGRYSHRRITNNTLEVQQLEVKVKVNKEQHTMLTEQQREDELLKLANHVYEEHLKQYPSKQYFNQLQQLEERHMENQSIKEQLYGPLQFVSYEEYVMVFNNTGLDVDGRQEVLQQMVFSYDQCLNKYINFLKILPGFKVLPLEDKIKLMKASMVVCDIICYYHIHNNDLGIWCDPNQWKILCHPNQLSSLLDKNLIDDYVACIDLLQRLDLTPEEQAMLQAYAVVSTGADLSTEGQRILVAMQDVIMDAFYLLLSRNHDNVDHFLFQIISVLCLVLEINRSWDGIDNVVLQKYPGLELTTLICDMHL